jgi:hypothetical protein
MHACTHIQHTHTHTHTHRSLFSGSSRATFFSTHTRGSKMTSTLQAFTNGRPWYQKYVGNILGLFYFLLGLFYFYIRSLLLTSTLQAFTNGWNQKYKGNY